MANMHPKEVFLSESAKAWQSDTFKDTLKKEIESLDINLLPLQQGLRYSSAVVDKPFQVMILNVVEEHQVLKARVMIFYSGVIAGCNCADDPTPMDEQTEQCELEFSIDTTLGFTGITLLDG